MALDNSFNEFVDSMLGNFIQRQPTLATYIGGKYHKYDALMDEGSLNAIEEEIAELKEAKQKLLAFDSSQLSPSCRLDRDLLIGFCELQLFFTDELKTWESGLAQGGGPVGAIGGGLFPLFMRDFASFEARIRSMIGRMQGSIEYLENSKKRWRRPIKLWTELAIKECQTTPGFFRLFITLSSLRSLPTNFRL